MMAPLHTILNSLKDICHISWSHLLTLLALFHYRLNCINADSALINFHPRSRFRAFPYSLP